MRLPDVEQRAFAATVAEVLAKHDPLALLRRGSGPRVLDPALWGDLTGAGLLEPAEAGDVLTTCLVAEELGRRCAPVPYLSFVLGATLAPDAPGRTTIGLLAPDGTLESPQLVVDGGLVTGTLSFVPDADVAQHVVVTARGGSLHIVDLGSVKLKRRESLDSTQPLAAVTFDRAPATRLENPDLSRARDLALAVHSASLVGVMAWLLDTTVEYTKQRVQFGQPIASRQAVKHACATMLTQVESSRALVLELADALENGDATILAAATKAFVSDAAEFVAGTAMQLHGGIGFTWEHDLHHYFKRATMGATLYGTAAHHRRRVAELLTTSLT